MTAQQYLKHCQALNRVQHNALSQQDRCNATSSCCMIFLILPVGKHVSRLLLGMATHLVEFSS